MTESELLERLTDEGLIGAPGEALGVSTWSNGPGDRYAEHDHGYDKVLVVDRGSIRFDLAEAEHADLVITDRLDLPAGTAHAAVVGAQGVRCLEVHLPHGRLDGAPRVRPGWSAETAPARSA